MAKFDIDVFFDNRFRGHGSMIGQTVGWAPPTFYFRKWWAVPTLRRWMPLIMVLRVDDVGTKPDFDIEAGVQV